jgi:hypothetical protein
LLLDVAEAHPNLAVKLLEIDKARFHLVAFILSLSCGPTEPTVVEYALTHAMRDVLRHLGFPHLRGARRALGCLPDSVLEPEEYQLLARLLAEPGAAKLLHHVDKITPAFLSNIDALPLALRTHVLAEIIGDLPDGSINFLRWIEIAAGRLPGITSSDLVSMFGECRSPIQLRGRLSKLVDTFPALEAVPPKTVGDATRIDAASTVRQIGKLYQNCLSTYRAFEIDGSSFFYHWQNSRSEAVCQVVRSGHLGWFLSECLGPSNESLAEDVAGDVVATFQAVGIYSAKIAETYRHILYPQARRHRTFAAAIQTRFRPHH